MIAYGFRAITSRLPGQRDTELQVEIVYADGRGLLRQLLHGITRTGWSVSRAEPRGGAGSGMASLSVDLAGPANSEPLLAVLGEIDGVRSVTVLGEEELE